MLIPNEYDVKWIDSIAESLQEMKDKDSFEECFKFSVNLVRRCCDDKYTKTNFLAYLLFLRVKIGYGMDEKLLDECCELVEGIINFDQRRVTISGLHLSINRIHRFDLREKLDRWFRQV